MNAPRLQRLQPNTPIDIGALTALRAALWDRNDTVIPAAQLLHIYEERWFYIDRNAMNANEQALLERLVNDLGNGVLLD